MKKIIHICFSDSAGGSLKYALKNKLIARNKVIRFSDDLSSGPIYGKVNKGERINWYRKLITEYVSESIEYLKESYYKFHKNISKINSGDIVYFWVGNNAMELCGLMYTLEQLNIPLDNAYIINVSNITYNNGKINKFTPRSAAEIAPQRLSEFVTIKNKLQEDEVKFLLDNWNKLKEGKERFRIYEDNKVINVDEDYFDKSILGYTPKEYRKAARVVGQTMGYSEQFVSDSYIFWRIQELIKKEMIEYMGNFKIMRKMEMKRILEK